MIARYLTRRLIGALMRLGRTGRGQERPGRGRTHTNSIGATNGPHNAKETTR